VEVLFLCIFFADLTYFLFSFYVYGFEIRFPAKESIKISRNNRERKNLFLISLNCSKNHLWFLFKNIMKKIWKIKEKRFPFLLYLFYLILFFLFHDIRDIQVDSVFRSWLRKEKRMRNRTWNFYHISSSDIMYYVIPMDYRASLHKSLLHDLYYDSVQHTIK